MDQKREYVDLNDDDDLFDGDISDSDFVDDGKEETYADNATHQVIDDDANKLSKKRELEKGPHDVIAERLPKSMQDQNYYNNFRPSMTIPINSPFLGLDLVIPNITVEKIPKNIKKDILKSLDDIQDYACKNEPCLLNKHDIKHFHCKGCGQPYLMNFENYHDLANREPHCKTCFSEFDYGDAFQKDWAKTQKDISEFKKEQYLSQDEEPEEKPLSPDQDPRNPNITRKTFNAVHNLYGEWNGGKFTDYHGNVYVDKSHVGHDAAMGKAKPGHFLDHNQVWRKSQGKSIDIFDLD